MHAGGTWRPRLDRIFARLLIFAAALSLLFAAALPASAQAPCSGCPGEPAAGMAMPDAGDPCCDHDKGMADKSGMPCKASQPCAPAAVVLPRPLALAQRASFSFVEPVPLAVPAPPSRPPDRQLRPPRPL